MDPPFLYEVFEEQVGGFIEESNHSAVCQSHFGAGREGVFAEGRIIQPKKEVNNGGFN